MKDKKAYQAAYRQAHKEELKAYRAAYRQAHKEERAAYYQAHKEEYKNTKQKWRDKNREKVREYNRLAYYKRKGTDNPYTKCRDCELCGTMFGVIGGRKRLCSSCTKMMCQTRGGLYDILKCGDIQALKEIRAEMLAEEGPAFTGMLMGRVCDRLRNDKEV